MKQMMSMGIVLTSAALMLVACPSVDEVQVGCEDDSMCREGRVCQQGRCVNADALTEEKRTSGEFMTPVDMSPTFVDQPDAWSDTGSGTVDAGLGDVCVGDRRCELCVGFGSVPLDFGTVPVSQRRVQRFEVFNCSEERTLYIQDFGLDGAESFELSAWSIGVAPFSLEPGDEAFVEVVYEPLEGGTARSSFVMEVSQAPDLSNTSLVSMQVVGDGGVEPFDNQCPVAIATGEPGDGSQPPEKTIEEMRAGELLLDGVLSYDRDERDEVRAYRWSLVESPPDARVVIQDTASVSTSTTLLTPGDYLFRLSVFDRWGRESCSQAEVRVNIAG